MPHIIILGTCDTKLQELQYLRSQILASDSSGTACRVTLIDAGRSYTDNKDIDISQKVLTSTYAPSDKRDVSDLPRGEVIKYMIACSINCVRDLYRAGLEDPTKVFHGIVSAGGTGGTSLVSAVMREVFPIGFPKLMVSTNASGDTGPVVGETDITMMYSVVDIAGTNSLLKRILSNAAGAITGMAGAYERSLTEKPHTSEQPHKRLGLTMFGVTTPCVDKVRTHLEANYPIECFVFHCTGHGGKAMERLVEEGKLDAVLDLTTTEICDELMGGNMSAGKHRLEAPLKAGIPYIVSVGATDMVNFGPRATVPEKYGQRQLFEHNPVVTLMRTSPEESAMVAEFIAGKINRFAKSPERVQVILPKGGVSMISTPGAPFYDAKADEALFRTLESGLRDSGVLVLSDERAINDEAFAVEVAERMAKLMGL
jgi:uncharacterized protein (UPF0261 family)